MGDGGQRRCKNPRACGEACLSTDPLTVGVRRDFASGKADGIFQSSFSHWELKLILKEGRGKLKEKPKFFFKEKK